jgi:LytS/YehU family sensor histidine kinase
MLIQPIIENIFLHAFNSSIKYKKIEIHVFKKENYIHFVIEDNGTGFIAKPENKVHKSIALETIIKRIDILNKVNKTSHSINIYNLNETQGKTGTKVEFKFSF